MKRILIDTNVYVAFKSGNAEVLNTFRRVDYIGISAIVLGELLGGFRTGNKEKQNLKELDEFLSAPRVGTIPVDETTSEFYAEIYRVLRQKGTPIPTNDLWIAATAMQHGLALYSMDAHFYRIEGLVLYK